MNSAESACCTPLARLSNVRARRMRATRLDTWEVLRSTTTPWRVGDDA
jgi:hypothetical protein